MWLVVGGEGGVCPVGNKATDRRTGRHIVGEVRKGSEKSQRRVLHTSTTQQQTPRRD